MGKSFNARITAEKSSDSELDDLVAYLWSLRRPEMKSRFFVFLPLVIVAVATSFAQVPYQRIVGAEPTLPPGSPTREIIKRSASPNCSTRSTGKMSPNSN